MGKRMSKSGERVRVRHVSGVEKDVLVSQLPRLSARWSRVTPRRKKRTVKVADVFNQPEPAEPVESQEG